MVDRTLWMIGLDDEALCKVNVYAMLLGVGRDQMLVLVLSGPTGRCVAAGASR
jgi:hypothetical protein